MTDWVNLMTLEITQITIEVTQTAVSVNQITVSVYQIAVDVSPYTIILQIILQIIRSEGSDPKKSHTLKNINIDIDYNHITVSLANLSIYKDENFCFWVACVCSCNARTLYVGYLATHSSRLILIGHMRNQRI